MAIADEAFMNIYLVVFVWIYVLVGFFVGAWCKYLGVEWLGSVSFHDLPEDSEDPKQFILMTKT